MTEFEYTSVPTHAPASSGASRRHRLGMAAAVLGAAVAVSAAVAMPVALQTNANSQGAEKVSSQAAAAAPAVPAAPSPTAAPDAPAVAPVLDLTSANLDPAAVQAATGMVIPAGSAVSVIGVACSGETCVPGGPEQLKTMGIDISKPAAVEIRKGACVHSANVPTDEFCTGGSTINFPANYGQLNR